jgi:hypothetical protein
VKFFEEIPLKISDTSKKNSSPEPIENISQ